MQYVFFKKKSAFGGIFGNVMQLGQTFLKFYCFQLDLFSQIDSLFTCVQYSCYTSTTMHVFYDLAFFVMSVFYRGKKNTLFKIKEKGGLRKIFIL